MLGDSLESERKSNFSAFESEMIQDSKIIVDQFIKDSLTEINNWDGFIEFKNNSGIFFKYDIKRDKWSSDQCKQ